MNACGCHMGGNDKWEGFVTIYNNIMNEQQRSLQELLTSFHED
jgi:hypothetical protein